MQFLSISLLTCSFWLLAPFLEIFNVSNAPNDTEFTIVIDAGHGGRDSGALGTPVNEKVIVLDVALQLGNMIQSAYSEVKVIYTRNTDKFIPLRTRTKIANSEKADLFVSIHCNSLPQAKHIGGSETYVLGISNTQENLEVAKRENASILLEDDYDQHYEGLDPDSDEGHILLSMVQDKHLEQSLNFAAKVENAIQARGHVKSRGVKQAGFQVLKRATMPAVLIELGYLTHASDNEFLQSEFGKKDMTESLFRAFSEYWIEQRGMKAAKPTLASEPAITQVDEPRPQQKEAPIQDKVLNQPKAISDTYTSGDEDQISYHLQLAASKKLINTKVGKWNKAPLKIEVKKEGPYYKYLSPSSTSLEEAKNWIQGFKEAGFGEMLIVVYKNGKRVKILK